MRVGYEINFNRHFYKPQPMRSLEEIRADILALGAGDGGIVGRGYRGRGLYELYPVFSRREYRVPCQDPGGLRGPVQTLAGC